MKKPYLNEEQRLHIKEETVYGSRLMLGFCFQILCRDFMRVYGFIFYKIIEGLLKNK